MLTNGISIIFRGQEFPLSTTLRVAYEVQNQHNHKPYAQIFETLGDMTLEDQISVLWAAFKCANKDYVVSESLKFKDFLEEYLDTYNLSDLMMTLKNIIKGITGKDDEDDENKSSDKDHLEGNEYSLV